MKVPFLKSLVLNCFATYSNPVFVMSIVAVLQLDGDQRKKALYRISKTQAMIFYNLCCFIASIFHAIRRETFQTETIK